MSNAVRAVIVCAFLALVGSASAQPVIWQRVAEETSKAMMVRDASSNLYIVTRQVHLLGRKLVIQKINALNQVQWTQEFAETGATDTQFQIRDLALSATRLHVLAHARTSFGEGAYVSSLRLALNSTTGAVDQSNSGAAQYTAIATGGNTLAMSSISGGNGTIELFDASTLASLFSFGVGAVADMEDLEVDAAGAAYGVSTLADGTGKLTKVVSGSSPFTTVIDADDVTDEFVRRVAVDSSVNRVYVVTDATFDGDPFDKDVRLFGLNATTGALDFTEIIGGTLQDDFFASLMLLPGQGIVTSLWIGPTTTRLGRTQSNGDFAWDLDLPNSLGSCRSHALDADGNVLLLHAQSTTQARVTRANVSTGALIDELIVALGDNVDPCQLFTDSAGNFYVNADASKNTIVTRLQPADLNITSPLVIGGVTSGAVITLASAASGNQTWNLTSSNPSAASVPGTVVVNNGASSANFTITTSPVTVNTNVSINARYNGFITQKTITLVASVISSVVVSPNVVIGGVPTNGTVNLTGGAPSGGKSVSLSSNKPAVASVPASVTVPAGASSAGFAITTFAVNANQGVVVTATTGATTKTAFFAVNAPSLTSISIAPGSIKGGQSATLTLNINGIAPAGGFSIVLISGVPAIVILSASASVPAGAVTHNVNVPTTAVTSSTNVVIFATRSGIYRTATITVTP